ncbi:RsmD family RNA methyltransferase [Microbacterium xanthum]|uniref:RsmD family RNA methyltransferase n=1 Tax=Microbacterium xanthum TaxID=3079794 RepID=UPI002AD20D24|nr:MULTISPECIES: RsmD family RNA methyltransferase [unclassified Microbacterium]MDZ8172308.1 RsmD family RNA methyltransferase [Microbacterium sp. KSW-48]MDZ8201974.1 RsmD family RNA methyltransferase [Microbacterium sp. SSW1-59]
MTRIISGGAGSLALEVPGAGTRPTSDRVRESVVGALESAGVVEAAAVLDLFAGSGALGLECLSRGAASADLVEKSPKAAAVTARNARKVASALGGAPARVHRASADAFLRGTTQRFDLVFLDPPYDLADGDLAETLGLLRAALSEDADVVIERATRSGEPPLPAGLRWERSRRHGDTTIWWARTDR